MQLTRELVTEAFGHLEEDVIAECWRSEPVQQNLLKR